MLSTITILLLSIIPHDSVAREEVDLMEINHFYDEYGRLVFDQVIFYDWFNNIKIPIIDEDSTIISGTPDQSIVNNYKIGSRFQVRAWRLIKSQWHVPYKDWSLGGYSILWQDGEQIRFLHSKQIKETWTQYDPELVERSFLSKDERKEFRSIMVVQKK